MWGQESPTIPAKITVPPSFNWTVNKCTIENQEVSFYKWIKDYHLSGDNCTSDIAFLLGTLFKDNFEKKMCLLLSGWKEI